MIYKKKYNIDEVIKQLKEYGAENINLYELLSIVGFDPIDVSYYYINTIRGSVRYNKEERR